MRTESDFITAYAQRTLQANDQNPFFTHAWDTVDVSLLRPKSEDPDENDDNGSDVWTVDEGSSNITLARTSSTSTSADM